MSRAGSVPDLCRQSATSRLIAPSESDTVLQFDAGMQSASVVSMAPDDESVCQGLWKTSHRQ